jgi:hypothetical protein
LAAGCTPERASEVSSASPSAEASSSGSSGDLAAVIERGIAAKPYSADAAITTEVAGTAAVAIAGRVNLNGPLSGTLMMKLAHGTPQAQTIEQVITAQDMFMRQAQGTAAPTGAWQKLPRGAAGAVPNLSLGQYAKLLVQQGAAADKGVETKDGVQAHRLSGKVKIEDVRTIEERLYNTLRTEGLDGFECDLWVDDAGRVIRLEQWIAVKGTKAHNIFTVKGFGPAITVTAPPGA